MIIFFFRGPQTSCSLWATDKCHHHQSQGGIGRESRTDKTTELANTRIRVKDSRNPKPVNQVCIQDMIDPVTVQKKFHLPVPHSLNTEIFPVGRRVSNFLENWKLITKDPWIIQCVEGIKFDFVLTPYQTSFPNQPFFNYENQLLVDNEIKCL